MLEGKWQLLLGAQETGGALEGERVPWAPVLSVWDQPLLGTEL